MKKLLEVLAVMLLFEGTSAYATGIYLAPKVNMSYGFGNMHDDSGWKMNPGIGAGLILGWDVIDRQIAIEASGSYEYWINDISGVNATITMMPILGGIKFYFHESIALIAGAGWTRVTFDVKGNKETENELSLYAGAEFELAQDLLFRPQFVYVDFEDDPSYQVKLEFAYRFGI